MYRQAIELLKQWKSAPNRKPLIIRGARQVGKTWLMKEFGKTEYEQCVYVNFDTDAQLTSVFSDYTNTDKLISALEIKANQKINPDSTLIIFDEIQTCPDALTSLKYFCENAPEYQITAAGSLLGISHAKGSGFPVGKVNFMQLYPLTFLEFLHATGKNMLLDTILNLDTDMINAFMPELTNSLKNYCFVGGMPEVVNSFVTENDYRKVRSIQKEILLSYEADFSKHTDENTAERINLIWNSVPRQLAKENSKFIYGALKSGARARDYETALNWLKNSGLLYKINRIAKPDLPLRAYEEMDMFKTYILDTGLLSALSGLEATTLLDGAKIFTEFKGSLTEQYVLQQLMSIDGITTTYWTSKSGQAEVDFVVQLCGQAIPVEVKAETNLRAKSLAQYTKTYSPVKAVKTSLANFETNNGLYNIPLAIIGLLDKIL